MTGAPGCCRRRGQSRNATRAACVRDAPHDGSSCLSTAQHRYRAEPWTVQHFRSPGTTLSDARRVFPRAVHAPQSTEPTIGNRSVGSGSCSESSSSSPWSATAVTTTPCWVVTSTTSPESGRERLSGTSQGRPWSSGLASVVGEQGRSLITAATEGIVRIVFTACPAAIPLQTVSATDRPPSPHVPCSAPGGRQLSQGRSVDVSRELSHAGGLPLRSHDRLRLRLSEAHQQLL